MAREIQLAVEGGRCGQSRPRARWRRRSGSRCRRRRQGVHGSASRAAASRPRRSPSRRGRPSSHRRRSAAAHSAVAAPPLVATTDGPGAPGVVFTDPQIAAVGHTPETALDAGVAAEAIDLATSGTAEASFHGQGEPGTTRFVVDGEREVVIGATFVGPDVADLLHAATIAVVAEVPIATLAHAVAPFPTRSELLLKLVKAFERERPTAVAGSRELVAAS